MMFRAAADEARARTKAVVVFMITDVGLCRKIVEERKKEKKKKNQKQDDEGVDFEQAAEQWRSSKRRFPKRFNLS